ncbi:MAG: ATP-binding cassette domain-containing protein [Qingshengfaniella sp.]
MLEVADLSVAFRQYRGLLRREEMTILSGIDLTVQAGEVVTVLGASGAGKSLLAHAILGLLPSNAVVRGQVRFEGRLLEGPAWPGLRGRRIALLPQQISHLDPLARAGVQIGWAARRAGQAPRIGPRLSGVGLSLETARLFPHELSGGMARRVMAAVSLAGTPGVLVADEPTAGLDAVNGTALLDRLRTFADEGAAVVLITHDLVPALSRSDRVALLRDGRLCGIEPASGFVGAGDRLGSDYARRLWRALPQNGFAQDA